MSSRILQSILFFFLDYNVKWEDHLLIITGFWINIIEGFWGRGDGEIDPFEFASKFYCFGGILLKPTWEWLDFG